MSERKRQTLQIPCSPTHWALLQAEFPMSDAEWEQMIVVLRVMKPSLIDDEEATKEPAAPPPLATENPGVSVAAGESRGI